MGSKENEMTNALPCSFCGKSDVEVMITGSGVNICNECVKVCIDIITAHEQWAYRKEVEKELELRDMDSSHFYKDKVTLK